jgi:hypothetical protein
MLRKEAVRKSEDQAVKKRVYRVWHPHPSKKKKITSTNHAIHPSFRFCLAPTTTQTAIANIKPSKPRSWEKCSIVLFVKIN